MAIKIVHHPEFLGPELFKHISFGEIFEHDECFYKKLPTELSQKEENNKKMGLAIELNSDGVYYFNDNDQVLSCDVRCMISYIYSREKSVIED
jgi:hypothetical protein